MAAERRADPAVRRRPDAVELAHPVDALALVLVPGHAAGRRVVVHGVAREDEHVDEVHVVDRLHDARLLVLVHRRPKGHAKHGVRLALLVVLARRTGAQREGAQEQRASPHGTHSASKRNALWLPAAWLREGAVAQRANIAGNEFSEPSAWASKS